MFKEKDYTPETSAVKNSQELGKDSIIEDDPIVNLDRPEDALNLAQKAISDEEKIKEIQRSISGSHKSEKYSPEEEAIKAERLARLKNYIKAGYELIFRKLEEKKDKIEKSKFMLFKGVMLDDIKMDMSAAQTFISQINSGKRSKVDWQYEFDKNFHQLKYKQVKDELENLKTEYLQPGDEDLLKINEKIKENVGFGGGYAG